MFSPKSLAVFGLAALSLPSTSMAYINSFNAPATGTVGTSVATTFGLASYISNWVDYGVVIGIGPHSDACPDCIGTQLGWTDILGASKEEGQTEVAIKVGIPTTITPGEYELKAGVMYLVGVSGQVGVKFFSSNITIS